MFRTIISSGKKLAERESSECPLMYEWHDKKYLGAAHGLVGIFYTLMLVSGEILLHGDATGLYLYKMTCTLNSCNNCHYLLELIIPRQGDMELALNLENKGSTTQLQT